MKESKTTETEMPALTALLIVDAQVGLLEGDDAVPEADAVLSSIERLLEAARMAGALVIHLQNDGSPGSLDEPGTPGWQIHEKLTPLPKEVVIRKSEDDGFENTNLFELLRAKSANRVAISGLLSEMCVSATARGALKRKLEVVLVEDAHATYDVDDIPARTVSRVAQHALGSGIRISDVESVTFARVAEDGN